MGFRLQAVTGATTHISSRPLCWMNRAARTRRLHFFSGDHALTLNAPAFSPVLASFPRSLPGGTDTLLPIPAGNAIPRG